MKKFLVLLMLSLALPAFAAETQAPQGNESQKATTESPKKDQPADSKSLANAEKPAAPNEYSCQFYTVKLPDDWQAILPPTESQNLVSAVFCKTGQNPIVTLTIGEHGDMDAKTIAEMFSEQFQAAKAPVLKNGQYVFSYTRNDLVSQVWVATSGPYFMITAIGGNQKEGLKFIKDNIESEKYSSLFPR